MPSLRVALFGLLLILVPVPVLAQEKPEVRVLKYDALAQLIRDNKGKVIVVDVWYFGCIECKKAMPHLVELQRKYAKDGLLAVTVNVDDEKAEKDKAMPGFRRRPSPSSMCCWTRARTWPRKSFRPIPFRRSSSLIARASMCAFPPRRNRPSPTATLRSRPWSSSRRSDRSPRRPAGK